MNPLVELNLPLVLFLPWFEILGPLYWLFPRQPRNAAGRLFDVAALVVVSIAIVLSVHWAHANADPAYGKMWRQILATAVGYGVFLMALATAFLVRGKWLRSRR